ncbi:hypothetical protein WMF37_45555 [Sorangium sp. So ce291]|uniref:hypothetical protein n=1 Tax=Sorangium sp. So ce291 TaxID=3133294 RepID=UPI003F618B32
MHYTIEELLNPQSGIVGYYAAAERRWDLIMSSPDAANAATLANRLTREQSSFEHECGGRYIGQEIMAIVGIARFYTTTEGFASSRATARMVHAALQASHCSIEVKHHATTVAESYHLLEDDDDEDDGEE